MTKLALIILLLFAACMVAQAQEVEEIPTIEQLETRLAQYVEAYPKLLEQSKRMAADILILKGAIARERQLNGEIVDTPTETSIDQNEGLETDIQTK